MTKEKDRAELYLEYIEDAVRELVVNFSESDSDQSKTLGEQGENVSLKFQNIYFIT